MRVAVVQLAIEPTKRTLTFQRALRAIDAAAETDPAPDLILLPAFCDVPAVMAGNTEIVERLAGQTVAACGLRARQWGVFVALGLAERGPAVNPSRNSCDTGGLQVSPSPRRQRHKGSKVGCKPYVTGVLLDNDGDLCLAHRQRRFLSMQGDWFATGDDVSAADVLLGRMTILTGDDVLDGEAWDAAAQAGAAVVLGTACWAQTLDDRPLDPAAVHSQIADHARRCGLPCAVADVTTADVDSALICPGVSTIVDVGGQILAAAEVGSPATLWAELTCAAPDRQVRK